MVADRLDPERTRDLVVTAEPDATIGDLAAALAGDEERVVTLAVRTAAGEVVLPPGQRLGDDLLANGRTVRVVDADLDADNRVRPAGVLRLRAADGTVSEVAFFAGLTTIGASRTEDVVVADPAAAPRYARLRAGATLELLPAEPGTRLVVDGDEVDHAVVRGSAVLSVGETEIDVVDGRVIGPDAVASRPVNRPPRRIVPVPPFPGLADRSAGQVAELMTSRAAAHRALAEAEHPSVEAVAAAVRTRSSVLWSRRPRHATFLSLRVGTAPRRHPDADTLARALAGRGDPESEVVLAESAASVPAWPVTVPLRDAGTLAVVGEPQRVALVATALLGQVVGLHSPEDVTVVAAVASRWRERLAWLPWAPHTWSETETLDTPVRLSASRSNHEQLLGALEARIGSAPRDPGEPPGWIVLVVSDDAPVDRALLASIIADGPVHGVVTIWLGETLETVPGACEVVLDAGLGVLDDLRAGRRTTVEPEGFGAEEAVKLSRTLAGYRDAESRRRTVGPPEAVDLADLLGHETLTWPELVVGRWRDNDPADRRYRQPLTAVVGSTGDRLLRLSLADGPAVVGGATGAGKTSLLLTWIMSLAMEHGPDRVNFLVVDPLGGQLSEAISLPHTVGLVDTPATDGARLLRRLHGEVIARQRLLRHHGCSEIGSLESRHASVAPPRLVLVVHEATWLEDAEPGFRDEFVGVLRAGRGFGIHAIVTTQRPLDLPPALLSGPGVRIALRSGADESLALVGTTGAAAIDQRHPGRGVVRERRRLTEFQTAYVGGTALSPGAGRRGRIRVTGLAFDGVSSSDGSLRSGTLGDSALQEGAGRDAARVQATEPGLAAYDEQVIAQTARAADASAGRGRRVAFPPPLPRTHDLLDLQLPFTDEAIAFGLVDDAELGTIDVAVYRPDDDDVLVIAGGPRSGRSTTLRTLAVSAGLTRDGRPVAVYAIGDALADLQVLQHVGAVIAPRDHERVRRLLRMLGRLMDDRSGRFPPPRMASLTDDQGTAGAPDETRILLLVDDHDSPTLDEIKREDPIYRRIVRDGRAAGVHMVVAGSDEGAERWFGRSGYENRLQLASAARPGSGVWRGRDVQVAMLGGTAPDERALAVHGIAAAQLRAGVPAARGVAALSEPFTVADLPADPVRPAFALATADGEPVRLDPFGAVAVLLGRAHARATADTLTTLVEAVRRADPARERWLFTLRPDAFDGSAGLWTVISPDPAHLLAIARAPDRHLPVTSVPPVVVVDDLYEILRTADASDAEFHALLDLADLGRRALLAVHMPMADGGAFKPAAGWLRSQGRALMVGASRFDVLGYGAELTYDEAPRGPRTYWVDGGSATQVVLPGQVRAHSVAHDLGGAALAADLPR